MTKPIVKIGCSAVLSREEDEAVHGHHISQAVALAVEQANERGNLPFLVEMVLGDDKAQVDAAVMVAKEFTSNSEVLGVVGTMNSHTSLATAPLYHAASLTQIAPAASNPTLSQQGYHTFFRVNPHDLCQGQEGAKYAVQVLGVKKVAIVHDGGNFGKPLAHIFGETAEQLGAQVVCHLQIEPGKANYYDAVAEVADSQPELVFFGLIEAEGRIVAAQLRQANVLAPFFGTDGLKPSLYLATPDYDVEGPYHTSACTDVFNLASAQTFAEAYRARYGELYSIYTAEAYDAANILIDACARATKLERSAVLSEVARTKDFSGASGAITFDHYGDRLNPRISIYKVVNQAPKLLGFTDELLPTKI